MRHEPSPVLRRRGQRTGHVGEHGRARPFQPRDLSAATTCAAVRHGEPAVKDVIYNPPWLLCAILGLIAGLSWTWRLEGTWVTGAIAGTGAPAALTLAWLITLLAQLRR